MSNHDSRAVSRSPFLDILITSVHTIALHPGLIVAYVALMMLIDVGDEWAFKALAGDGGSTVRRSAALMVLWTVETPFYALIDAALLSAIFAVCRGVKLSAGRIAGGTARFAARMFLINVILVCVLVLSRLVCLPAGLLAVRYLEFVAVYIVWADVSVSAAFRQSTAIVFDREARFAPLYYLGTALLVVVVFGKVGAGVGIRGWTARILGDAVQGYADLIVRCASFFLYDRMQHIKEQQ